MAKSMDQALELKLTARQTTYSLNLGGKSPAEFRRDVQELERKAEGGAPVPAESFPPPPTVDLLVEIVNRGSGEVEIWLGGDDASLTLDLTGPGALTVRHSGPFTADLRHSSPVKLAAGGRHALPLERLCHGFRGCAAFSYWTEPGEYLLSAHLQLGKPSATPAEMYDEPDGPTLDSNSVRLTVRS